jgi:hypothetical protein
MTEEPKTSNPNRTDLLARLRLVAAWRKPGGPTPSEPMPSNYRAACDAVDEIVRLRRGWLRVIQQENSCPATGTKCLAKRCGCLAEMEMLANEQS